MKNQLAVFFDYDNIKADPIPVLNYLNNFGKIVLKRCYMDSTRDKNKRPLFFKANVDIVDRPRYSGKDKNGTDIHLALDVLETVFTLPNINIFVILSGDSDYLPLVNKIR